MSRIVVTGASGFLGRYVCEDLRAAGHDVVRAGRDAHGELCDLDTGAVSQLYDRADGIVHLAGALSGGPDTTVSDYLAPNVALTEEVLLRGAAAGATRFVFSSSRLVYPSDLGRAATEADEPRPEIAYGWSKLFAEQVVEYQAGRHGISATSLRIAQLVGPGDANLGALARFGDAAFAGAPIRVAGRGRAVRDYLDVRDAARAARLAFDALTGADVPRSLNVGGGGRSIADLAGVAARAAGRDEAALIHLEVDDEDTSHWSLDTSLAAETIGWRPLIDLTDTLLDRRSNAPNGS